MYAFSVYVLRTFAARVCCVMSLLRERTVCVCCAFVLCVYDVCVLCAYVVYVCAVHVCLCL